ncbi:hypothetical protein O4H53_04865 [Sulfitobacter sp. G21635-S1]|nr:hypothetical protein [Sulfitobacter sp. G21635-S1]
MVQLSLSWKFQSRYRRFGPGRALNNPVGPDEMIFATQNNAAFAGG